MSNKVPNGWKECKLGDVCSINMGQSPSSEYYNKSGDGLPFLQGNRTFGRRFPTIDVYCTNPVKIANKGDILFSVRAPVGEINIANEQVCIGRGLASLRANVGDNSFLFYLLCHLKDEILSAESGTVFGSISKQDLEEIKVPFPPLPEQRAIASVLSSLDDKIDLLHRENKTLEAMAETLFRQWFIEEAKDEWEEKSLKDIYIFEKGFEPGSENYLETEEEDAIRFIRVGDMLSHTPSAYIKKSLAKSICSADDLLMSFDGTPGRLNFGIEGAYSSGIRRIYSLNPVYDNLGLKYLIFKSKHIQDTVNAHSSGTVILHASSSIDELTFSFPDERKLEEFNEMITPIFSKIQLNKRQFRILEKLRDTLLPKLMSGEIRVKYEEEEISSCRA